MGPDEVGRNFIPERIIIKNLDLNCDQFLGLVNISQKVIKILIPIQENFLCIPILAHRGCSVFSLDNSLDQSCQESRES
jgi:hypothetical protein